MITRQRNIKDKWYPFSLLVAMVLLWQMLLSTGLVPPFMLPSPGGVVGAFIKDVPLILKHSVYTLFEGMMGLCCSLLLGYGTAIGMDRFRYIRKAVYPLLVVSQTIPYIAIAPLLVVWLGYDWLPKVVLVTLTCFFPVAIGVFDGIRGIPSEYTDEFQVLGGNYVQGLFYVKMPMSLPSFFSTLKIAATYSLVGAVVAEWIGGTNGLGVYMTRVRKSYEYDKMFAVIFFIMGMSLVLMAVIKYLERKVVENHE